MKKLFSILLTAFALLLLDPRGYCQIGYITGPDTICLGSSATLSDTTAGGLWSTSDSSVVTIDSTSGIIMGIGAGTATITYSVDTAFAIFPIVIDTLPDAGVISGVSFVCVGTTNLYNDTSSGGLWTLTNTHAHVLSPGFVQGNTAGIDTLQYTVSNSCGIAETFKPITINTLANSGTISGPAYICNGSIISLSETVSGGAWSCSDWDPAYMNIDSTGTITDYYNESSYYYDFLGEWWSNPVSVIYTVENECGSNSTWFNLYIDEEFQISEIPSVDTVCTGSFQLIYASSFFDFEWYDPFYYYETWSSSNDSVAYCGVDYFGISGFDTVFGMSPGPAQITFSCENECGWSSNTQNFIVTPAPAINSIAGDSIVCVGSNIFFTDSLTGGTWSTTNPFVANFTTDSLLTGVSSGTVAVSYTVNNSCGTSFATKQITVNPAPYAGTITDTFARLIICPGIAATLTDTTLGGFWSASNSHAIVLEGVATAVSPGIDTIMYSVTNSCGTATANKVMTINTAPNVGSLSGPFSICAGATVTLTGFIGDGYWGLSNYNVDLYWGGVITGILPGTDSIYFYNYNSCGLSSTYAIITINPLPTAGIVLGSSILCVGSSTVENPTASGGVMGLTNLKATISGDTLTGVTAGYDTLNYIVTNSCGTASTSKTISVSPLPPAGIIIGIDSVCVSSSVSLSDSISGGSWHNKNPLVAGLSTISYTHITGITAGIDTIMYTDSNYCGSFTTFKSITVLPLPYAGIITGADSVCVGAQITLSDSVLGGMWIAPYSTASIVDGVVTGLTCCFDNIEYRVTNSCGNGYSYHPVNIIPPPYPLTIYGDTSVCIGSTIALSPSFSNGSWSSYDSTVATVTQLPYDIGVVTGTTAGIDTIYYNLISICGSYEAKTKIEVDSPTHPTITGPSFVCVGRSPDTLIGFPSSGVWWVSSYDVTLSVISPDEVSLTGVDGGLEMLFYQTNLCGVFTDTLLMRVYTYEQCDSVLSSSQIIAFKYATNIYPNPASTLLNIEATGFTSFTIFNTLGQELLTKKITEQLTTVDIQHLNPGLYYLSFVGDGQSLVRKFLKE